MSGDSLTIMSYEDFGAINPYLFGYYATADDYNYWREGPDYQKVVDAYDGSLQATLASDTEGLYDRILLAYPSSSLRLLQTVQNSGGGATVGYSYTVSHGFTTSSTESVSVKVEADATFLGTGGKVTVEGSVSFSQGEQQTTSTTISMDVAENTTASLYQVRCNAVQIGKFETYMDGAGQLLSGENYQAKSLSFVYSVFPYDVATTVVDSAPYVPPS